MLVKTDVVAANSPEEVALASDLEPIHLGRRCGLGGAADGCTRTWRGRESLWGVVKFCAPVARWRTWGAVETIVSSIASGDED